MNNVFQNKKPFISFITAGDPSLDKTEEFISTLADAGSDLVGIGIPFSDPIAEGEIIEKANLRALKVGTTTDKVFDMVKNVRGKTQIPMIFLTYINPVFAYGSNKFFARCKECGVTGVIIPDLPFEERNEVLNDANQYGVDIITIVAPTSKDRIPLLVANSTGFIYLISSMGANGIDLNIAPTVEMIRAISKMPVAVDLGIPTEAQAKAVSNVTDGVIVSSAIVKIIEQYGDNASKYLFEYVQNMKKANS